MQEPRTQLKELWRSQHSATVDPVVAAEIDDIVVESTANAMIAELVDWDAVCAL
jgi:hypothetical protein